MTDSNAVQTKLRFRIQRLLNERDVTVANLYPLVKQLEQVAIVSGSDPQQKPKVILSKVTQSKRATEASVAPEPEQPDDLGIRYSPFQAQAQRTAPVVPVLDWILSRVVDQLVQMLQRQPPRHQHSPTRFASI